MRLLRLKRTNSINFRIMPELEVQVQVGFWWGFMAVAFLLSSHTVLPVLSISLPPPNPHPTPLNPGLNRRKSSHLSSWHAGIEVVSHQAQLSPLLRGKRSYQIRAPPLWPHLPLATSSWDLDPQTVPSGVMASMYKFQERHSYVYNSCLYFLSFWCWWLSVAPLLGAGHLIPSSDLPRHCTHVVHRHTGRQNTHMQEKKKSNQWHAYKVYGHKKNKNWNKERIYDEIKT